MTGSVTMRNSKGRTALYVLVGCSVTFLVYVLSSTHNKLKSTEESNDKCQQQRDSLSAQLQVLYEHKSRLEKSLQSEMADRKKAENEMKAYKETAEKQKMEAHGRYAALQQRYEEVKKNNQEDFNNLKGSYASLVGDKEKLEADMGKYVSALEQEKSNEAKLQEHIKQLTSSLRIAEAAVEQEKAKYNMAQNQLDSCQAVRYQQAAQLAQSNVVVRTNNQMPGVEKSVMKEQRDAPQPLMPNAFPVVPSSVVRSNLVPEKSPVASKDEVQSKDEKQSGGALGPSDKEQQKLQAPALSESSAIGLQIPHSANKIVDRRPYEKPFSSSSAAGMKLDRAPVVAVPPSAGAVVHSPNSSIGNAADQNLLQRQAVASQDANGLAVNYQAAPPHDQAPPPPPPPGDQQQQEAPQRGSLGLSGAGKPLNALLEDQKKENQQESQGAIPAPQAADLQLRKEEVADNVLVPPKSAEAGDGGEGGPAEAGRVNAPEETPKMGNLARPLIEAPQQVGGRRGPVYPHVEEDNREYAEPAREDDAGDDQDADGAIFGADHRKQFQDADFDDQMVEPENQQAANQIHGEGLMVNPK